MRGLGQAESQSLKRVRLFGKKRRQPGLEHIHKLFYGLEKVRVEAFADFFLASIEFMDKIPQ
jgi:hypothetical protein